MEHVQSQSGIPAHEAQVPHGARRPLAGPLENVVPAASAPSGQPDSGRFPSTSRLRDLIGSGSCAGPLAGIPAGTRCRDLIVNNTPGGEGSAR
jgi:hypothetical protein